jgi:hypothetical protein
VRKKEEAEKKNAKREEKEAPKGVVHSKAGKNTQKLKNSKTQKLKTPT